MNFNAYKKKGYSQIYLVDSLDKRLRWYTGVKVKGWKKKATGEGANFLNEKLDNIKSIYSEIKRQLDKNNLLTAHYCKHLLDIEKIHKSENYINEISEQIKSIPLQGQFLETFKLFIKASEDGTRKTKQGKKMARNTINTYGVTYKLLEKFETETGYKLEWKNINYTFYEKLTRYCWDKCEYYDGTVGLNIAIIMAVLNWAVKEKIIHDKIYTEEWIVWKEDEVDALVIYPDEIPLLYNMPLKEEWLIEVKDLFIFGCLTLLRSGNLLNLYKSDLKIVGDTWHINPVQIKVGGRLSIKLPPIGIEIIKKYRNKDTLLPTYKYNEYAYGLSKLAEKFREYINSIELPKGVIVNEWNKPFVKVRYRQGKPIKQEINICDVFNTHCERSTGAVTLLINGVPEFMVKKIGGWSKDSKSFGKYVRIAQQFVDARSDSAWDEVFKPVMKVG
jgi:hypothetical protein